MIKPLACLIILTACWSASFSQNLLTMVPPTTNGQYKDFMPASPNAASLGTFGQIPVGNYTGTASVSVPFYTVSYRDLNVPIGISYHADGNKPDVYPGLVGQGWALSAGGSITRVIKGIPDYQLYPTGNAIIPVIDEPTAASDWSSTTNLNTDLASGGFFSGKDRGNSDEFYFNFGGVSGRFYIDYGGVFRVKSDQNTFFSVSIQTATNKSFTMPTYTQSTSVPFVLAYNPGIGQQSMIYKITLTDDHGIQYVFGGTDNSIEFSRPGHDYGSYYGQATIHLMVTPMTWQLTSIVSPNGYAVTFDYTRAPLVTKVGYSDVTTITLNSSATNVSPGPVAMAEKSTLVDACYLTTITSPKEIIVFSTSPATNQLQYQHDTSIYRFHPINQNMFSWYSDISQALTEGMIGRQLDAITVNDITGSLYKTISLGYTNSTNTRLKLMNVTIKGSDNKTGSTYLFDYNPQSLPPYLSNQTDAYGYYNGRTPPITSIIPDDYFNMDQNAFNQSKLPDPNYVQAEILTKITYPTGGFTQFIYEPNDYGTEVQTWPFTTVATANTITGGVRIKQTISYSGNGQKAFSKQYHYVSNYLSGGTGSSGVLAYKPVYVDSYSGQSSAPAHVAGSTSYNGAFTYWQWSNNPIFPMGETNGHHITYSEVTEISDDGSAIVYKYKNYDNGYNDVAPVNQASDNTALKQFWKEEPGISMDLERGQPLSEEYYDATGKLKQKKAYEYNSDPNRFNSNVRVLSQVFNSPNKGGIPSMRIVASLFYTYFPYLAKVTQTEYEDGGQPSLESIVTYEYDNNYRSTKKQQTTSSDGRVVTMLYNYPQDMVAAGITDPYQDMVTAGMVNVLISTEHQSDGVSLNKATTAYSKNLATGATLMLPQQLKTQFSSQPEEVRINFNQYDNKGNLLCQSPPGGIKTCYVWSYNSIYPVAKIENADYTAVLNALGGQQAVTNFATSFPDDNTVNSFLQPLRTDPGLSAARVMTYTYDVLRGMTSETNANQRSSYYEYDFMGRLSIVRDHDHNILKKICYNYAGLQEDCGAPLPYDVTEFGYSSSLSPICNNGILQVVIAYSKKPDPEALPPGQIYFPTEYFTDQACTIHVPDGYYKFTSFNGSSGTGGIYYIVNGVWQHFVVCF